MRLPWLAYDESLTIPQYRFNKTKQHTHTTGVDKVLADDEIEVDHVPVDVNLVAAVEALDFALIKRYAVFNLDSISEAHADRRQAVKKNWLAFCNMALETALLAVFKPCLALPHMQELDAVKENDLAGGLIPDDQTDKLFELISLQIIVHAFGMAGGKKKAETATNCAMWEKPDVHVGLVAHQPKIRPFFDNLTRINFTSVESCLEHLQASHITNFIRLAACTKSLPREVRDVYDKVADKIRPDGVQDISVNTLAKAAQHGHELQSVFESKRINPVVKKHFDPAFKKKHQEEYNLQALHGRDDTRGADVRGGRTEHGGAALERGRGPSIERGRGRNKSVDRANFGSQIEARSCVLLVTALSIALVISNALSLRRSLAQLFKSVLNFQTSTKARRQCANSCVNLSSFAMRRRCTSAYWVLTSMWRI